MQQWAWAALPQPVSPALMPPIVADFSAVLTFLILPPGRFGAKNLAAMKARRGSSFILTESADNMEEETEKSVQPMNRQQSEVRGPATQAVELQQPKPPVASNTSQLWEETAKSMQSQIQEQEELQKKPPVTSKLAAPQSPQEDETVINPAKQSTTPTTNLSASTGTDNTNMNGERRIFT